MSAKGEQTRKDIVGLAVNTVAKEGFAGLSIGGLAKDLGLSKSGVFAHFRSKEQLQLSVLAAAEELFVHHVVRPAIREPRGLPRVHALFRRWARWATKSDEVEGGCIFVGASYELDDTPGALRDAAVQAQKAWIETLRRAASLAVDEGHFRADLDPAQFAYEAYGVLLGRHLYARFLRDPAAPDLSARALRSLLERASDGAPDPQPIPELT